MEARLEKMILERQELIQKLFRMEMNLTKKVIAQARRMYINYLRTCYPNKIALEVETAKAANLEAGQSGRLRVGKIAGRFAKGPKYPVTIGYLNVVVTSLNKNGLGSQLSPFVMRDEQNRIMENIWQFSKIYASVPKVSVVEGVSSDQKWSWKAEVHDMNGEIQPAYWCWREAGMNYEHPVRSPVPVAHRSNCLGAIISSEDTRKLDYMEAREQLYIPLYARLVRLQLHYDVLRLMLKDGYNIHP
jgi:hypothetical protein